MSIVAIAWTGGCVAALAAGCRAEPAAPPAPPLVVATPAAPAPPAGWAAAQAAMLRVAADDADAPALALTVTALAQASLRGELTVSDAATLLDAAVALPPEAQPGVIDALLLHVRPGHGALIERHAAALAPAARARALIGLAVTPEPTAHASLARLLAALDEPAPPPLYIAMKKQRRAGLALALLPLLDHPVHGASVTAAVADHCRARVVTAAELAPHAERLHARWRAAADAAAIELVACLPRAAALPALRDAAAAPDAPLALAAIAALARLRTPPPKAAVAALAARPEARARLFQTMAAAGWRKRVPARFATQAALAEAVLVEHLSAPDQLGRPPAAIEPLDVVEVEVDEPEAVLAHHVFRFRVDPPDPRAELGWMLGVAGPFVVADAPTVEDRGGTRAALRAATDRDAARLVDAADVRAAWRDAHVEPPDGDTGEARAGRGERRARDRGSRRRRR
jgi:hypothetical protein